MAEHFAQGDRIIVILGGNLVEKSIKKHVEEFIKQPKGAKILLKKVPDPQRFGVAEIKGNRIIGIAEKPRRPKSDLAVTGIYMYDQKVFDIIKPLKPSKRGELEITDVNNEYIKLGKMTFDVLDGWWTDAGLPETLYRATTLVRERELKRQAVVSQPSSKKPVLAVK